MIAPVIRMDSRRVHELLAEAATIVETGRGFWGLRCGEHAVYVLTDEAHNRMRIMSPVAVEEDLDEAEMRLLLEANFDRTLDARFALADEIVWSLFVHPLDTLSEVQLLEGLGQVVQLAENFGTTYTSTDLLFGADLNGDGPGESGP